MGSGPELDDGRAGGGVCGGGAKTGGVDRG